MLDGIFQVLSSIGEFFSAIYDFISGLLQDLVNFVQQLLAIPVQIATVLGGFPIYFVGGIGILIGIMVVLRVVGRD